MLRLAAVLLCALGLVSASALALQRGTYEVEVTRIENNVYKDELSGAYIITTMCFEIAVWDEALLKWYGDYSFPKGKLIFLNSDEVCEVKAVR